jgi:aromatic-L-amino-acid/L-tryptophan decarboxylase
MSASVAFLEIRDTGFACTARAKRTLGFRRPQTLAASVQHRSGGRDRWEITDGRRRVTISNRSGYHCGDVPFLVVGTAGSVSTGAVDPLSEISALCKEYGIWFHVDGAYGDFAAAVPEASDDLRALSQADSVAVDPHKWLYAPLEAGCALVRDPEALRATFAYHPPYYHFEERVTNYVDYGPQNSRGFRALKVWLALRHVGAAGYRKMIADDIRLSQAMSQAVSRHADLQLVTQELSITTFRYVPRGLRTKLQEAQVELHLDALNRELVDRLQRGGETFVSNAVVGGHYVVRACIVNFHTAQTDVEALPDIVARIGREVDAELRPVISRHE